MKTKLRTWGMLGVTAANTTPKPRPLIKTIVKVVAPEIGNTML